jgi:hypothetical protein
MLRTALREVDRRRCYVCEQSRVQDYVYACRIDVAPARLNFSSKYDDLPNLRDGRAHWGQSPQCQARLEKSERQAVQLDEQKDQK